MDTDSNDGTSPEILNGQTKPDPAKLAQTAIIKQDVMLSATSTQSPLAPVSSVFTMPSVSLPHASIAGSGALGLADQLFMSVPSVADTATTPSATDTKSDINGVLPTLTSQTQLLGQPQVASQFFLTNQQAVSSSNGSSSASIPVQQILIPVSTGNGTQQFISIPVSLATGGNQQIQLLSTSNGQIIATNLASLQALAQPLNLAANSLSSNQSRDGSNNSSSNSSSSNHSTASSLSSQIAAALPPLLTANSQGQLLAVSPQMISQMSLSQVSSSNHRTSSSSSSHTHNGTGLQSALASPTKASLSSLTSSAAPTVNGLPPNVSQLLPNTVGNCTESTTVDGINLDEIKEFARQFKIRRLSLGLTQTQVGQALSATEGPAYSQSAICR